MATKLFIAIENEMAGEVEGLEPDAVEVAETEALAADAEMSDAYEEVEEGVEALETAEEALEELEDQEEVVEKAAEEEGLSPDAAEAIEISIEHIARRLGYPYEKNSIVPATESFASESSRKAATEDAKEKIQEWKNRIVETMKKFWEALIEKVVAFWNFATMARKRMESSIEKLTAKAKELKGKGAKPADDAKVKVSAINAKLGGVEGNTAAMRLYNYLSKAEWATASISLTDTSAKKFDGQPVWGAKKLSVEEVSALAGKIKTVKITLVDAEPTKGDDEEAVATFDTIFKLLEAGRKGLKAFDAIGETVKNMKETAKKTTKDLADEVKKAEGEQKAELENYLKALRVSSTSMISAQRAHMGAIKAVVSLVAAELKAYSEEKKEEEKKEEAKG